MKETPAAKVFISYQWDMQDKVLKLKKKLEANKITCWMDTGKVTGGDDLKKEIDKGIRGCKVSVLISVLYKTFVHRRLFFQCLTHLMYLTEYLASLQRMRAIY